MARTIREIVHEQMQPLKLQPDYGSSEGAAVPRGEDRQKQAFNKENGPELLGQLLRVLKSNGMDDALQAIKSCGLTRKLNDEWMSDTRNRQKRKRDRRAAVKVDPEMLKAWKRHVLKNQRRWGRHDADDWLDEAISYAEEYWKAMNLDPGDDVPMREVERWAEKQAPGLIAFAQFTDLMPKMASASRVATAYQIKTSKRKEVPRRPFRHPGGQKHRLDPEGRPGARPPSTWDDVVPGRGSDQYIRAVKRMLQKKTPDQKILRSLTTKWRLSPRDAQRELDRIKGQLRLAKKVYSLRDFQTAAFEADRAVGNAVNATIHLKEMWDSFEEIPPKQQPLYDLNLKTMYQLSKPRGYANNVYEKLKRYR